jgi:hypothetical protein
MSLVEISINDAVTEVATSSAPIPFPDTCALVDLIGPKVAKLSPAATESFLRVFPTKNIQNPSI